MQKADTRNRNYAAVVYPDSAPENWREILKNQHVPAFISPLHDRDINADGSPKKPHWHIVLKFAGKKSLNQVTEITNALNAPAPQVCKDIRAYARYLCHLDNPEKAQYDVGEVECLGGADYLETISTAADIDILVSEIEAWIDEQGCYSYAGLCRYARQYRPDWARLLRTRCTLHITAYIKSCLWEHRTN